MEVQFYFNIQRNKSLRAVLEDHIVLLQETGDIYCYWNTAAITHARTHTQKNHEGFDTILKLRGLTRLHWHFISKLPRPSGYFPLNSSIQECQTALVRKKNKATCHHPPPPLLTQTSSQPLSHCQEITQGLAFVSFHLSGRLFTCLPVINLTELVELHQVAVLKVRLSSVFTHNVTFHYKHF